MSPGAESTDLKTPTARWLLVTGEYPPQAGGVSDYTRILAQRLQDAGDEVYVFAPGSRSLGACDGQVAVVRSPGGFALRGLRQLNQLVQRLAPCQLLVQYVPHSFGWKGMNVLFCLWLWSQRTRRPWVMFHEVYYPFERHQRPRHRLLALVTRLMAWLAVRSGRRLFVSTSSWSPFLTGLGAAPEQIEWLPIPSTIPRLDRESATLESLRRSLELNPETEVVGHFGTFGQLLQPLLEHSLLGLLRGTRDRVVLLIGRGAEVFARKLAANHPELGQRLRSIENASAEEVARHLSICHCLVQPYPDGISTRRTTAMAGLALGVPIVTTSGPLTDSIWKESGAVELVEGSSAEAIVAATERVLADKASRETIASTGQQLYDQFFAVEHTIARLREPGEVNHRGHRGRFELNESVISGS